MRSHVTARRLMTKQAPQELTDYIITKPAIDDNALTKQAK